MPYLDKSDTYLKLALQVTHRGMREWNLLTGQVSWSINVEQLFGLAPRTLQRTYRDLLKGIFSGNRPSFAQAIALTIRKRSDYAIKFRISHPDKSMNWLKSQGEVQGDVNQEPVKIISLCQDVISSKQAKDRSQVGAKRRKLLETGRVDREYRIVHPNGAIRGLRDRIQAIFAAQGNPTRLNGIVTDISHHKPIVTALKQANQTAAGHLPEHPTVLQLVVEQLRSENIDLQHREGQKIPLSQVNLVKKNGFSPSPQEPEESLSRSTQSDQTKSDELESVSTLSHPMTLPHQAEAAQNPYEANGGEALVPKRSKVGHRWTKVAHKRGINQADEPSVSLNANNSQTGQADCSSAKLSLWQSLIQHSSDLITIVAADGTLIYNNPVLKDILGYSPDELVGQPGLNYIDPQDAAAIKQAVKDLLVAGHGATSSRLVCRALRKDGSSCTLEAIATNLLADEAVGGLVFTSRDVTERFQSQEVLEQSEACFQAIFDNAALGIALSNPSGEIILSNPALQKLLGYSEQELRDRTVAHPEDVARDLHLYQELLAGSRSSYQLEKRYFHKNGNLVWGRLSVSLIRHAAGNPMFVVSMVEDITAAKQTEAQLLSISKAVENASDAIAIADTVLSRLTYLNPAFCQLFGYTLEQLNAAGGFGILFREPKFMQELLAIALRGHSWQGEIEMVSRCGATKQIALRTDAIKDVTGEVVGTLALHTDITQRKQAEVALKRSYERAELLKQITTEIRSSLDPQHIFQSTVMQLGQALSVNRCIIYLYQDAPQAGLSLVAEYLEPGHFSIEAFEIPVEGNPHAERVLATDQAIASTNVYAEPLLEAAIDLCRVMDVKSMLAIRTSYQGEPNGVLGLHQCDAYRQWESSEIELLEAVAAQVGIALAQASLLEKEKQTAAKLAQQNFALQLSEAQISSKATELERALLELQRTQAQLVQTEKMSSLGQLVAGVAHEINNPVGFITVNINYACDYIQDLLRILNLYQQHYPQPAEEIKSELQEIDLDFLIKDFPKLLNSMQVGADRINQIVLSLRKFSRPDEAEMKPVDIHESIDNTLMILRHRLNGTGGNPKIEVIKEYGMLPLVECYAGQLNQVFMNLISNAIDALESESGEENNDSNVLPESGTKQQINFPPTASPTIKISTEVKEKKWIVICIQDNGLGMTEEVRQQLFQPFFTTKAMGKGTGLGLSISYQIVVEKHGGDLHCFSVPGQGTQFMIEIPLRHCDEATA